MNNDIFMMGVGVILRLFLNSCYPYDIIYTKEWGNMYIYEELHSRYIQLYASAMDLDKDHHTKFDLVMKNIKKCGMMDLAFFRLQI